MYDGALVANGSYGTLSAELTELMMSWLLFIVFL